MGRKHFQEYVFTNNWVEFQFYTNPYFEQPSQVPNEDLIYLQEQFPCNFWGLVSPRLMTDDRGCQATLDHSCAIVLERRLESETVYILTQFSRSVSHETLRI